MEHAPVTLEALYTRHGAYLRALVTAARVPRGDVEDVVHDIVTSLYESGGEKSPELASVETWLYTVTRNHVAKYYRRVRMIERANLAARSLMDAGDVEPFECPDAETPEEAYLRAEGRKVLEEALARMAPELRNVLKCRLVDELPWDAIAVFLRISSKTAMRRYAIAVRELEADYMRWAGGSAFALPLPIVLIGLASRQRAYAAAAFTGRSAGGEDALWSAAADGTGEREGHADSLSAAPASPRRAREGAGPRERTAGPAFLHRLWRSPLTHFLLGAGVAMVLLSPHSKEPPGPPGPPEPPKGQIAEAATPTHPLGGGTVGGPVPQPQAAVSVHPAPSGLAPGPSGPSPARRQAPDPDATDRFLLGAARRALAEGRRESARALLQEHAERWPDSPRASQRDAMRTQLSH